MTPTGILTFVFYNTTKTIFGVWSGLIMLFVKSKREPLPLSLVQRHTSPVLFPIYLRYYTAVRGVQCLYVV